MKWALLILFQLAIASCSFGARNFQSKHSTDLEERNIRRIAVLFPGTTLKGPAKVPFTAASSAEAQAAERDPSELLSRLVYSTMTSLSKWRIVSESEVREVGEIVADTNEAGRLKQIGELVYADAVIVARMQRFRERVGAEWGIQSPASVAFVLDLVDVRRGDIIWSARFDETQQSPAENLLVLGDIGQRGLKWLSAEQLAQEGVRKAVGQLHQIIAR